MADDTREFDINAIAANLLSSNPRNVERAIADLSEMFSVVDSDSRSLRQGLDTSSVNNINEHFNELSKFLDLNSRVLKDVVNLHESKVKVQREKVRVLKEEIDILISNGEVESERYQKLVEAYKESAKILKGLEKYERSLEKGKTVAEGLLQATLGLQKGWSDLGIASARGFFPGIVKGLSESLTLSNLFGSTVMKVFERVKDYDAAQASLFEKTAISRDRLRLVEAASDLGPISKDIQGILGDSAAALKTNLRSFGDLSDTQVKETTKTIAVLSVFGVSQQDSAEAFLTLTKTLGKTPEQTNAVMNNFVAVADAISRPPGELLSDFNKAAPILTRFGNKSEKIFKDVTMQAKNLELEVSQILTLHEGMDTFEGAAKAAQSFNLAIGQPFLSAQALLAAEGDEKLKLVQEAFKRGGKSVEDLPPLVIRGLAQEMSLAEDEIIRILKGEKSKTKGQREKMDIASTTLESNVLKAQNSLNVQGKIDAKLTHLTDQIVDAIRGDEMLNWVATKLADNIVAVVGGLTALGALASPFVLAQASRGATALNPEHVRMSGPGSVGAGGGRMGKLKKGLAAAAIATAAVGAMYGVAHLMEKGKVFDKEDNEDGVKPDTPEPTGWKELLFSGFFDEKMQEEVAKEEQSQKEEEAKRTRDLEIINAENAKTQGVIMSLAATTEKPEYLDEQDRLDEEKDQRFLAKAEQLEKADKKSGIFIAGQLVKQGESLSEEQKVAKHFSDRNAGRDDEAKRFVTEQKKKKAQEKARELQEKKAKEAQTAKSPVKEALNEERVADNLSEKQSKGIRRELIVPATEDGTVSLMGFGKSPEREQFDKDYPPGNIKSRKDLKFRNRKKDKYQRQYLLRTGQLKKIVTYEDLTSPMSTIPNMSTENMEQNYVQPVFNKKDKFYAAKADGPLAKALDEILAVTKKLLEQKGDVELSISERKFAAAVEDSLAAVQRK